MEVLPPFTQLNREEVSLCPPGLPDIEATVTWLCAAAVSQVNSGNYIGMSSTTLGPSFNFPIVLHPEGEFWKEGFPVSAGVEPIVQSAAAVFLIVP